MSVRHDTPRLRRRAEFEAVLRDYRLSEVAKATLAATPLVVLNGPSGTGRNTVIRELVKTGYYHFVVSDTTRPPRYNDGVMERNGEEYFFRTEEEMLEELRRGEFIEAEIIHDQQVSGQSIREIRAAHDEGKIALNEIEIMGVLATLRHKPDAVAILLLPPSFDEWLSRLHRRNAAVAQDEINRRLRTAMKIFTTALERELFHIVINDDLAAAVRTIDEIARLGRSNAAAEGRARVLAGRLLRQTEAYLAEQ